MKYPRLVVLGVAATLAFCGFVQAVPSHPTVAPSHAAAAMVPAAQVPALPPGSVQVAMNTLDAGRPLARSMAADGAPVVQDAAPSYLGSATRYAQDVGSFWSGPATAPKIAEVPLPGALWLFGSALIAFLAISVRRKF